VRRLLKWASLEMEDCALEQSSQILNTVLRIELGLTGGRKFQCKGQASSAATQGVGGLPGGATGLLGFGFSVTGGDVSGSIAILGSTIGGVTVERGSGIV
jgi:hypothetical protein